MSTSKVIGNQSSRFPAMLSVLCQIQESYWPILWFAMTLITVELKLVAHIKTELIRSNVHAIFICNIICFDKLQLIEQSK